MPTRVNLTGSAKLPMLPPPPQQNKLLASLGPEECERVCAHLELVNLPPGKVLYEVGDTLQHVYFPTDGIVSVMNVLRDGACTEIFVVGNDGMIGISLFMGRATTPYRIAVQSAGHAYRLSAKVLIEEFQHSSELHALLLRYTLARITQLAQTAICNRYHSVEQHLCRWLLLCLDRQSGNELKMTHELIAGLLGVRREGISEAAGSLQNMGVIRYSRGVIAVLDRAQLESLCCECYADVKKETARIQALTPLRPLTKSTC